MWIGLAYSPTELLALAQAAADAVTFTSLGWEAWLTLATLFCVFVALVRDAASPDLVMVSGLVFLLLVGAIPASEGLSGFAHPALITIAALFVVAAAVRRTGALAFLGRIMMPRSSKLSVAYARLMLPTSFLSSFLNNTPIVAFLTPLVQEWGRRAGIPASKLLIPLSYATILGGMGTLIGTSTNLVVSDLLDGRPGQGPFAMFELIWIGIPVSIVGWAYFALVGGRLLPRRKDDGNGIAHSRRSYQFDLRVPPGSSIIGRTIEEAGLRHLENAFLTHIQRGAFYIGPVNPTQKLEAEDVLAFTGDPRVLEGLLQKGSLSRPVELPIGDGEDVELPLYEAVVSPQSTLVGKTLKSVEFRDRFDAVVLGIHRQGKRVAGSIGQSPIEPGDLLLIEARPGFDNRWVPSNEFYLVAPLERGPVKDAGKAFAVLIIILALVGVVTAGWLPMVIASLAAAMLVILVGAVSPGEARRSIDLSVIFVIASALGFERAIDGTELDAWLGGMMADWTKDMGVMPSLLVVYLLASVLTEFLTNSVAAALAFPVAMAVAQHLQVDPRPYAIVVATAASASFITPIGYQTNLMVMGPGGYRFRDFMRVGAPLSVLVMVISLAVIYLVWIR